ncbi:MAG: permease [Betaproteobacteria bacterium]|nr:permease [Betaproteobacteria bacterium]
MNIPIATSTQPPLGLRQRLRRMDKALLVLLVLLAGVAVFDAEQSLVSAVFLAQNLWSLGPVLLLSVGLAAAIKASSAEALVARAFTGREGHAVLLASVAGALSPLCSCGVVPLIAGLLAGGVPLAPVMAFWLASPIMDPAMFVLTAGAISFEFALVKTVAAIAMGLLGGAAVMLYTRGQPLTDTLRDARRSRAPAGAAQWVATRAPLNWRFWRESARRAVFFDNVWTQLTKLGVLMAIAFVLESLMLAYVPAGAIAKLLGGDGLSAIPAAVALGVPAYLNGVAAVPLVGGLIAEGMNPAVGLAFMVAGGVTSIPAMLAVWALVKPRVFAGYLVLAVLGALAVGYAYAVWLMFWP